MQKAFTLIELLVVVLIIGILSAVALPQYQKAVWKSKNVQLKELVRAVSQAEQSYYMANGEYTRFFDNLDIDLPLQTRTDTSSNVCDLNGSASLGAAKLGKDFAIALTDKRAWGVWTSGPYQCKGFAGMSLSSTGRHDSFYCIEIGEKQTPSKFCEQLEGANFVESSNSSTHYYSY